jgi:hypothetical protein
MAIRNNHWYNINEQRSYPVDETASAVDDSGVRLPNNFIVDLKLSWSLQYGRYSYISAASATEGAVSVLISVCSTLDDNLNDSRLVAGVTISKDKFQESLTYKLNSFLPGAAGYIVFGSGAQQLFSGLYANPQQSLLTARAARALPNPTLSRLALQGSATEYSGLLQLIPGAPLRVRKEPQLINGKWQENVLVFGLEDTRANASEQSAFETFSGGCSPRVGSQNCGDPQPLQSINGIRPDCSGNVTLDFRGCAVVGRNSADCGVIVDCNLSLEQSCRPPYLPDISDGQLPGARPPLIIPPVIPPGPDSDSASDSISEGFSSPLALPYCDTFDLITANSFNPVGPALFTFVADDSPAEDYCCNGPAAAISGFGCDLSDSASGDPVNPSVSYGTNVLSARSSTHISLFGADTQTLYRRFVTDVKIQGGVTGTDNIAGILANYRFGANGLPTYYIAAVDAKSFSFNIFSFNGINFVTLVSGTDYAIRTNEWMRIRFSLLPGPGPFNIQLSARLQGITRPSLDVQLVTDITSTQWGTDSGLSGLYILRSLAYFSFWRVEQA